MFQKRKISGWYLRDNADPRVTVSSLIKHTHMLTHIHVHTHTHAHSYTYTHTDTHMLSHTHILTHPPHSLTHKKIRNYCTNLRYIKVL